MEEINKMHKTSFRLGHVAEADGALDRRNEQRVGIARAAPTLMRRARVNNKCSGLASGLTITSTGTSEQVRSDPVAMIVAETLQYEYNRFDSFRFVCFRCAIGYDEYPNIRSFVRLQACVGSHCARLVDTVRAAVRLRHRERRADSRVVRLPVRDARRQHVDLVAEQR